MVFVIIQKEKLNENITEADITVFHTQKSRDRYMNEHNDTKFIKLETNSIL